MLSTRNLTVTAVLASFFAGCSGMGSTPVAQAPSSQFNPPVSATADAMTAPDGAKSSTNKNAIDAVNALGSPVKTYEDENANQRTGEKSSVAGDAMTADTTGTCKDGFEFWVPDKAGDPDSTEGQYFYDAACTQLARDVVRKWTPASGGSETVNRTASNYAQGNPTTPVAVRTAIANFSNGTFGKNGFPVLADGFALETSSQLNVGTSKSVLSDSEMVLSAATSNNASYCTDSAGYNSIGIPKLDETFGWNGGAFSGGSLTINSNGTTTWSATHKGETESAPIGSFSISKGAPNSSCPITTPAYTLSGGTVKGSYTLPITVTFKRGIPIDLTVTNGTLASGNTLNVTTNTSRPPLSTTFITGTVAKGTTAFATFTVNALGNGTLTVSATGNQYVITDWNVVR